MHARLDRAACTAAQTFPHQLLTLLHTAYHITPITQDPRTLARPARCVTYNPGMHEVHILQHSSEHVTRCCARLMADMLTSLPPAIKRHPKGDLCVLMVA
eukprot:1773460-Prymnesium_polylepis.1